MKKNTYLILGTFDLFHYGHYNLIAQASELYGEENIVIAIASDVWLKIRKKNNTWNESERMKMILFFFPEIRVIIEESETSFSSLKKIVMDYNITHIISGEDQYKGISSAVEKYGIKISGIIKKNRTPNVSSSLLKTFGNSYICNKDIVIKKDFILISENFKKRVFTDGEYFYKEYLETSAKPCIESMFLSGFLIENEFNERILKYKKIKGETISDFEVGKKIVDNFLDKLNLLKNIKMDFGRLTIKPPMKYVPSQIDFESDLTDGYLKIIKDFAKDIKYSELEISHGDLSEGNILINNDFEVNFIDFEDARITFKGFDLCNFIIYNVKNQEILDYIFLKTGENFESIYKKIVICSFNAYYWNVKISKITNQEWRKKRASNNLATLFNLLENKTLF